MSTLRTWGTTAAGLSFVLAGLAPQLTAEAAPPRHSFRVAATAPSASPGNPLPRERVVLRGRIGSGSRAVSLQRRSTSGWVTATKGRTERGAYRLSTLTLHAKATYRVVAPASSGRARLVSQERTVQRLSGSRLWHWNDLCRGSSDPAVYRKYCALRDSAIKRGGRIVARDFHAAWRRSDVRRMKQWMTPGATTAGVEGNRATSASPDCSYDGGEARWYCWTKVRRGTSDPYWMGFPVEIHAFGLGQLPVWRVPGVAPDV